MGFSVTKIGNHMPESYREFIVDTVADLALLPGVNTVCPGSRAYCSENGLTYTLETDGDWVAPSDNSDSGDGGSSGSDLPAVTSADNGNVLTVVNGAWDKAAPGGGGSGGGGGVFVVTATYDEDTEVTTLDKTWQEIWDATAAGQFPAIVYMASDETGAEGEVAYINNLCGGDGEYVLHAFTPYYDEGLQSPTGLIGIAYTTDSADGYPSYGNAHVE